MIYLGILLILSSIFISLILDIISLSLISIIGILFIILGIMLKKEFIEIKSSTETLSEKGSENIYYFYKKILEKLP